MEKNISVLIGERIKEIRKKEGLTQAELAQKINVDPKYISRLETGSSTPSIAAMARISAALKTNLSEFFIIDSKEKRTFLIENINLKLNKASYKELNVICDLVGVLVDK